MMTKRAQDYWHLSHAKILNENFGRKLSSDKPKTIYPMAIPHHHIEIEEAKTDCGENSRSPFL
ncbi:MAG: hypothetical protein IJT82_09580 [Schwartzia sp.]|nr:hypothetical protein [Schwartzia sp. (in: firmicutes)]